MVCPYLLISFISNIKPDFHLVSYFTYICFIMYPYVQFWDYEFLMTGIWAVLAILIFLVVTYILARKYDLNYYRFFSTIWLGAFFVYFMWKYSYLIIDVIPNNISDDVIISGTKIGYILNILVPNNVNDLIMLISPSKFEFHYIGLLIWFFVYFRAFLQFGANKKKRSLRVWSRFLAFSMAMIPLWFCLLMGDDFVGRASTSDFFVSTFSSRSELIKYDNVYPVGFMLSIWATFVLLINYIIYKIKNIKNGYIWFAMLLVVFMIVILYQQYPRHLVASVFGLSIDIKHYVTIFFVIILWYHWVLHWLQDSDNR